MGSPNEISFEEALTGLRRGDFSRMAPLFRMPSRIIEWDQEERFAGHPETLAEALTCACFLGRSDIAAYLLTRGVDPAAGAGTGMNAFHWAANRGSLDCVRLLIGHKASWETRSMYGGTVLGTALWSAANEPRPDHLQIIEELLSAGARPEKGDYPTGNAAVDALLKRHGV